MSAAHQSAESRSNSPEGIDATGERRATKKRKVLSCYACRNRKMKCDRVYPVCGRCQKTGRTGQCTYDPRLLDDEFVHYNGHVQRAIGSSVRPDDDGHGNSSNSTTAPDALTWKLRTQERRLEILENKLAEIEGGGHHSPMVLGFHTDNLEDEESPVKEAIMFRGKSFKTQFHGSTSPMSLIGQFVPLKCFTQQAMPADHTMSQIRTDFKGFRDRRKAKLKAKGAMIQGTDAEILGLLPGKPILDARVKTYFENFESAHRILHRPSFLVEYEKFWTLAAADNPPTELAAMLILIIGITNPLVPDQAAFIGDRTSERESAVSLIGLCDAWIARRSWKQVTMSFYQLQCLSLLAKRVNCIQMKQDWVNIGDIVRVAIATGMHRDPGLISGGRISEFEKEMRRRLWATTAELELQSSIDCGLQSSLYGLYFDIQPPANVSDETLTTDSKQAPTREPTMQFTDASYLNISAKSLPLRIHLAQILNNPSTKLRYSDVLHYDTKISALIASLPTSSWKTDDDRTMVPAALLDLQLRQFLVVLHMPYARVASSNPHFSYSFTACLNAASGIIEHYGKMKDKGIVSLLHARNDIFRVGIILAQVIYHNCDLSPPPAPAPSNATIVTNGSAEANIHNTTQPPKAEDPTQRDDYKFPSPGTLFHTPHMPSHNFLASTLIKSGIILLEHTIVLFETKVMSLGTGYMEYWLLSAAIEMIPSPSSTPTAPPTHPNTQASSYTTEIQTRGRAALDRMTRLCARVVAMQKDPGNDFANHLMSTMSIMTPPSTLTPDSGRSSGGIDVSMRGVGVGLPGMNGIPGIAGMAMGFEDGAAAAEAGAQGLYDEGRDIDMQVDLSGWAFADFWSFDVGGDF
ncbi:hypothetical protein BCR34DRAFT_628266 [Clohesyomyces aquaticus]|uniref:Zn(2)-C6 fungal-type domain-containing protein n=1 Tax=Clohesyomyces aquaticus TaxID=1231657 RepID=A0A1Y1YLY1_9PLEO|nr:hypothetical protein BCR34DRAFT_628266 [Clohesyomyces aquaticus]